jgi:hypothetical protein
MPPDAIGIPATLFLYQDRVKIVAGRFHALHPRLFERNAKSTLPEHRADAVAKVSGKRGKRYLMREHLLEIGGGDALDYLTEITHRWPRAWTAEVEQLHALLQQYGPDALRTALARAVAGQTFGVEYVRHFLYPALHSDAQGCPRSDALDPSHTSGTPLFSSRREIQ